jgi:predicted transcriptional regulator YheO
VPLEENGKIKALLCINCDVSIFEQIHNLIDVFLPQKNQKQPEILFKNDWQEKLHLAINQYLKQQKWQFDTLKNAQKKALIEYLYNINAFSQKNSPDYLAKILNMGRATIFKYLKTLKVKK